MTFINVDDDKIGFVNKTVGYIISNSSWNKADIPNNDDNLNYRPAKEINYWIKNDPLKKLEKHIIKKKYSSILKIEKIKMKIKKEITKAFKFAEKSPLPKIKDYLKLNLTK